MRTRLSALSIGQSTGDTRNSSISSLTKHIVRNEGSFFSLCSGGFRALYRGLVPTIMGIAPYVALNFTIYERTKMFLLSLKTKNYICILRL